MPTSPPRRSTPTLTPAASRPFTSGFTLGGSRRHHPEVRGGNAWWAMEFHSTHTVRDTRRGWGLRLRRPLRRRFREQSYSPLRCTPESRHPVLVGLLRPCRRGWCSRARTGTSQQNRLADHGVSVHKVSYPYLTTLQPTSSCLIIGGTDVESNLRTVIVFWSRTCLPRAAAGQYTVNRWSAGERPLKWKERRLNAHIRVPLSAVRQLF